MKLPANSRLAIVMCWAAGLSALLAAIGALLPWGTVDGPFADFVLDESNTPEATVLISAAVGAVSAAGFAQWRKRLIGGLGLLAGLVITFVGAVNFADGGIDAPDFMDTSPEAGLYMVLIAGALLVVSAVYLTLLAPPSKSVAESDESEVSGEAWDG